MPTLEDIARRLDDAVFRAAAVAQLDDVELSLEDAYEVQRLSIHRRLARGERRIGVKMGFTSRAKMVQMGISDVIWGRLTDAMLVEDGSTVSRARFVHPRVEPELAFLLGKPLGGTVSALAALDAVVAVAPALEIIDSRYRDFKFSLTDVVADNSSSSALVTGAWRGEVGDISNLGLVLEVNGRPRAFGSTAALLGHPLRSLVAAARVAAQAGEPLAAGDIVMAGGATAAVALAPGDAVCVEIERLGRAAFTLVE